MDFGKMLEVRRVMLAMTQQEVADLIGVNIMTYSRWERNVNKPMKIFLEKIAEVLGIELIILKGDEVNGSDTSKLN